MSCHCTLMGFFYVPLSLALGFWLISLKAGTPHLFAFKGGGSSPGSLANPSQQEAEEQSSRKKMGKAQKTVLSHHAEEPPFFIPNSFLEVKSMSVFLLYPTHLHWHHTCFATDDFLRRRMAHPSRLCSRNRRRRSTGSRQWRTMICRNSLCPIFKVFLDNGGDVNAPLPLGDPALEKMVNWNLQPDQFADGPFAGQSMNCRNCHLVDEQLETTGYGMRTYMDFARRSPIPAREDGKTVTLRNSPPLVNASLPRNNFFLHADAEFPSLIDLVQGTLTGRNYGWLPGEQAIAMAHVDE